jgi:hypothetical protein
MEVRGMVGPRATDRRRRWLWAARQRGATSAAGIGWRWFSWRLEGGSLKLRKKTCKRKSKFIGMCH